MTDQEITQETIEGLRQSNIGRLFARVSRAYSDLAFEKLTRYGYEALTPVHTALISNLDIEGTRITTIAERAGVTKQAIGQLANDLEKQGYIERIPDPEDGRASLLKFTQKGWQFLLDAHEIKKEIEAEYKSILGAEHMAHLRETLEILLEHNTDNLP